MAEVISTEAMRKPSPARVRTQRLAAIGLAVGVTILFFLLRERLGAYEDYLNQNPLIAYGAVFLINLLGSGTVILPVPALLVVYLAGDILNPLLVGVVAGVASALGELTGYLAGYGGQGLIENRLAYQRVKDWMRRGGRRAVFIGIFVLSLIPNPVFDVAGIASGALRFPLPLFLLAAFLGKSIKMFVVAVAGAYSLTFMRELIQSWGL